MAYLSLVFQPSDFSLLMLIDILYLSCGYLPILSIDLLPMLPFSHFKICVPHYTELIRIIGKNCDDDDDRVC